MNYKNTIELIQQELKKEFQDKVTLELQKKTINYQSNMTTTKYIIYSDIGIKGSVIIRATKNSQSISSNIYSIDCKHFQACKKINTIAHQEAQID